MVAHRSDTARVKGSSPFEATVAVLYWFTDKHVALVDTGSIPVSHPNFLRMCSSMVEQSVVNRKVGGSSPSVSALSV